MEPIDIENIPHTMKIQLFYIIHQFLRQHNLTKSCHEFERIHSLYFDMAYFKELIVKGDWDTLEHYLEGFTSHLNNDVSKAVRFEIGKHKFLEAVERDDHERAKVILESSLSTILGFQNPLIFELDNLRSNNALQRSDVLRSKEILVEKLPQLIESDTNFKCKLELPRIDDRRLITFAMHCLMLQYSKCACPMNPLSLLEDHQCPEKASVPDQSVRLASPLLLLIPPSPEHQIIPITTPGSIRPRRRRLIKTSEKIALQQSSSSLHRLPIEQTQIFTPLPPHLEDSDEGESLGRRSKAQILKKKRRRPEGNSTQSQLDIVPTSQSPPQPPPPQVMEKARPISEQAVWDLNVADADGSEEMAEALLMLADNINSCKK